MTNISNILDKFKTDFTDKIKIESGSRKQNFTFGDAIKKHDSKTISQRDKSLLEASQFLYLNPLKDNDFHKYVTHYVRTNGERLNPDYFRHDLDKLEKYYELSDREFKEHGRRSNHFSKIGFQNYVCFMFLKLKGGYNKKTDDLLFNVTYSDSREYNPLTTVPSVLRGTLPFTVKEYDIAKAFPTFIDIELDTNFAPTIYDTINKKDFARIINTTKEVKGAKIEALRNELKPIYGNKSDLVITNIRFEEKGKAFRDFTKYEKDYIDFFVEGNNLKNFVRLHDGVFVLSDTECEKLEFERVKFVIKPCIKPAIRENAKKLFYRFSVNEKTGNEYVETTPVLYSDWFIQEDFKKISLPENELLITRNSNNVIEPFNHVQDIAEVLKTGIVENEERSIEVLNQIAKDVNGTIKEAWLLIKAEELNYYRDTKNSFGLAFKNGFFYFDDSTFEIKRKEYTDVNGFFVKHPTLERNYNPDTPNKTGDFEKFFIRSTTGGDVPTDDYYKFRKMFGYLIHNYKNRNFCPLIILSDASADGTSRDGQRGKGVIQQSLIEVTQMNKQSGGSKANFNANSEFAFDSLKLSDRIFCVDDVEASFPYDTFYSMITNDSSVRRKGKTDLEINFKDLPKFLVSTNYVVRFNAENSSDFRRFQEYKLSKYYSKNRTPLDEFGKLFFGDEWDQQEWNLFYNFCFACVKEFIQAGCTIDKIQYDKVLDNFNARFSSDVFLERFENTLKSLIDSELYNIADGFSSGEFLDKYFELHPQDRFKSLLNHNSTKSYLQTYFEYKAPASTYSAMKKRWKYKELNKKVSEF